MPRNAPSSEIKSIPPMYIWTNKFKSQILFLSQGDVWIILNILEVSLNIPSKWKKSYEALANFHMPVVVFNAVKQAD